jgi:hypothetical protein
VFFLLDFAANAAASAIIRNVYLAYKSAEIHPETASLSFLERLKVHLCRPWKTSTWKMASFKTFGAYLLPAFGLTPGIMLASHVQHQFETGVVTSVFKAGLELSGAAMYVHLYVTLVV